LLKKFEDGVLWLALTPDARPVSQRTFTEGSMLATVNTYADGSIGVDSVSAAATRGYLATSGLVSTGVVIPMSVYGCSVSGSSGYAWYYTNCVADVNLGVIRMYFNFNYQYVRGSAPTITRYWNNQYVIIGGALSNQRFVEMSSSDVRFAADFSVAFKGFPVGWTAYMGVRVSTAGAVTYNN
jgi:hypothetical protein